MQSLRIEVKVIDADGPMIQYACSAVSGRASLSALFYGSVTEFVYLSQNFRVSQTQLMTDRGISSMDKGIIQITP